MPDLSRDEKRKYAMAMRRVDYGIWGYKTSLFRVITLTTREGDDNTTGKFGKDFRKLIAWFRKLGYKVEYCGVFELSPGKWLLHWHGILRVKGGYFPVSRRELGDKWNELHNAFAVKIESVEKMAYLQKYINKHMVKDYVSGEVIRNKFLVSGGWGRKGVKELIVEFKKWWVNVSGDYCVSSAGWAFLKILVRRYCEGENMKLANQNGCFSLSKGQVRSVIYAYL